ncbi:Capsular glucan synthase [Botrimarina colliarenosi]|uniref:Capsular glucan synthase n=1 Tax=Botrimarina colliarenosi TaxID=2528001 RepID=A0A5C6AAL9_9BACT|nr:glycosyltransferase family 4 protein [Botrimarina colliarenosi]TWT97082.1 Capsular glucan synthase [Botrimarina colliarenosi]
MRIAYLAAGAAGMYCGSCLHDNTLANALRARGEDVFLVPTYTPLRTDEPSSPVPRIFFGGVNSYLKQVAPWFRRAPRWLERLVDHPRFLKFATSGAGSVDPAKLGALTVSMLRGEEGNQARQLDQLVDWLVDEAKPDVVHLSNSMLLGMARRIADRCGPPVVCSLSGEDLFLEALTPPHYEEARALLRERAAEVAGFTALNGYYADFMAEYLAVDRSNVHVVPHGLSLDGIAARSHDAAPTGPLRIGYFARVCHEKGLHLLVEACELLAEHRPDLPIELHAGGYLGAGDRDYLIDLRKRSDTGLLAGKFHYHGELDRAAKYALLASLDVFSTPTIYAEAKGLPALEAMAVAVPVVLPGHGSFPEMIAVTGGGLLHDPHDAGSLAETLAQLLDDPAARRRHGEAGHAAIRERFHADQMAEGTLAVYRQLIGG